MHRKVCMLTSCMMSCHAGHACMSAVFVWYTAGYFMWAIYFRHRQSVFGNFIERKSWLGFFLKDLGHALALYWILLNVRQLACLP